MKKRVIVIIAVAAVAFCACAAIVFTSFLGLFNRPRVYALDFSAPGMRLTLTNEFTEASLDHYTACFEKEDVRVLALEDPYSETEGLEAYTAEEYGTRLLAENGLDAALETDDGLTAFSYIYTDPDTGDNYYYYSVITKGSDAFWTVQFTTPLKNEHKYQDEFVKWAKTIEVY